MTRTFQVDPFIPFQALMILCLCFQTQALHSQEEEESHYFTLRGGLGIRSNSLAIKDRMAFGLLVDTNFLFIPAFAAGIRTGANISSDTILSMEAEAYARWYFWRPRIILGSYQNTLAPFAQGGLGLLTGYNGIEVAKSRGTLMAGGAIGVNIPLFGRWSIEPSVRFGYPFIAGFSLTLGYRFPSLQKAAPPNYRELLKYIIISQVEYILFPPNIAKYNENLDDTTRAHNDLILNEIIKTLTEYPELWIRVEGHANPTGIPEEDEELYRISLERSNEIARILKSRGVNEEQIVVVAHGGTRTLAGLEGSKNRRVELMVIQLSDSQEDKP